ncbi:MAG: permease [Myxococcales bacterium]|nr:permease [Myxococcales bacterium]
MALHSADYTGVLAEDAPESERSIFIKKTYLHLAGAILAFILVEGMLVKSSLGERMMATMVGTRYSWLIVLGGFMAVGWIANAWARSARSPAMQYAGLALYVVAEAVMFLPLLYMAAYYSDADVIPKAAITTGIVFGGLTAIVLLTKRDFSWMGPMLGVACFGALAMIVSSLIFGFNLGTLFSVVMVVIAAGYILYYTSNVLHHYPIGSHVAASLALFAAVALLFWYVLRLFSRR